MSEFEEQLEFLGAQKRAAQPNLESIREVDAGILVVPSRNVHCEEKCTKRIKATIALAEILISLAFAAMFYVVLRRATR